MPEEKELGICLDIISRMIVFTMAFVLKPDKVEEVFSHIGSSLEAAYTKEEYTGLLTKYQSSVVDISKLVHK